MAPELRTPLCRLLEIEHPILSVGFAAGARAEIVAAVSGAGAFGVLGASGVPPGLLRAEIAPTKAMTDRPFGVNIIIAEDPSIDPEDDRQFFLDQIRAAADEGASAVVLFWGDPTPFVDESHAAGLEVLIQVGSVEEAEHAASAGVDAVIVQGVEAGGHVPGTTSIWELLPAAVEALAPCPWSRRAASATA